VTTLSFKEKHEFAVANDLLAALRIEHEFLRLGAAGIEPDVVYRIAAQSVGIEVATAYHDEPQAKAEWQIARGILKPDNHGITKIGRWSEPDQLIAAQVQRELEDKCAKDYSGVDSTWLCIEQRALLVDVSETSDLVAHLKVPERHPFVRIYVGAYAHAGDGGGFRVYELPFA